MSTDRLVTTYELQLGRRVKLKQPFRQLPAGTEGVIDERTRVAGQRLWFVAWDLEARPLPFDYWRYDKRTTIKHRLRRDGLSFDELGCLEAITT